MKYAILLSSPDMLTSPAFVAIPTVVVADPSASNCANLPKCGSSLIKSCSVTPNASETPSFAPSTNVPKPPELKLMIHLNRSVTSTS